MPYPGALRDAAVKPEWGATLDMSHPLAQGLQIYAPFAEGGGKYTSNVIGNISANNVGSGATWAAEGLQFDRTVNGYADMGLVSVTGDITIALALKQTAQVGTEQWPIATCSPSGVNFQYGLRIDGANTNEIFYIGHGFTQNSAANVIVAGKRQIIVCTVKGGAVTFFVDGAAVGLGSTTGTFTTPATNYGYKTMIGKPGEYSGGLGWNGAIYWAGVWGRALSAGEVSDLVAQPYGMFLPGNGRRFYTGGGQTLTKLLMEALSYSDARTNLLTRLATESLSFTDTRADLLAKLMAETLALTDARSAGGAKGLSEAAAFADALVATLNTGGQALSKLLAEALGFSDAKQVQCSKAVAETLNLSDSRMLGIARQIGEVLGFTDSVQATGVGLALLTLVRTGALVDGIMKSGHGDSVEETGGKA